MESVFRIGLASITKGALPASEEVMVNEGTRFSIKSFVEKLRTAVGGAAVFLLSVIHYISTSRA